jgi:uncharacterized protein (DUF924 family)
MSTVAEIIDFWFGTPDRLENGEEYGKHRSMWFKSDPIVDGIIQDRFLETYHAAAAGLLADWQDSPLSCLALTIALDQFPRNMFRGTPNA